MHLFNKMLRFAVVPLLLLIEPVDGFAQAITVSVNISTVDQIASGHWSAYAYNSGYVSGINVLGYHTSTDGGGGAFIAAPSCPATAAPCVQDADGNHFYNSTVTPDTARPQHFGARGDGIRGNAGVANGTATFTDTNASWSASLVGKTIDIVPNINTTDAPLWTTVLAVGSPASLTLQSNVSWSGTGVTYYIGTDDHAALDAFNLFLARSHTATGYGYFYNTYTQAVIAKIPGPNIYLTSSPIVVGGDPTTSPTQMRGVGGKPTVVVGNLGSTTDCVNLGAGYMSDAGIENVYFECSFSGRYGIRWEGFQSPFLRDVAIDHAQVDCIHIEPSTNSLWIQNTHNSGLILQYCGKDGFYFSLPSGSFFNEADFKNVSVGDVSSRQGGGAAWRFHDCPSSCSSISFDNWKATQNYNSATISAYAPSNSPIVIEGLGFGSGGPAIRFTNGYSENSPSTVGACAPIISVAPSSSIQANVETENLTTSQWAAVTAQSLSNGQGIFAIAPGSSVQVIVGGAHQGWIGDLYLYANQNLCGYSGANYGFYHYSVFGPGGLVPTLTTLNSYDPASLLTTTGSLNGSGQAVVTVRNNDATHALILQTNGIINFGRHSASGINTQ